MKKTKFAMFLGSLILACAAFVAGKPGKKFVGVKTAFAANVGAYPGVACIGPTLNFFTTTVNSHTAIFKTSAGVEATLFSSPISGIKVYVR